MSNDSYSQNESSKSGASFQIHSGHGDNVSGDKIISQAISPTEIQDIIRRILTSLRHRKPWQAKEQLETLKIASSLDADTKGILDVISILIQLAEGSSPSNGDLLLRAYLVTKPDALCTDIAISAQLRLDVNNVRLPDARERYISSSSHGIYTKEVFYEFIADKTEVETTYHTKRLNLTEIELCGLVRGALRLKIPKQALIISEYLNSISSTFNSKTLIALSKKGTIELEIEHKHYWCITATLRSEILGLCDDTITLLNDCEGRDARIINLSAVLLHYVCGEYKPLADTCWCYISEIEHQFPEIAVQMRHMYEKRLDGSEGFLYKMAKANEDPSYKVKIINEITSSKEITVEDSALLSSIGDIKSLRKWIEDGGSVSSENQLEKDFSILELKSLACDNSLMSKEAIRLLAEEFISRHKTEFCILNPPRVIHLVEIFLDLELYFTACELIKPHVPSSDWWVSPTLCCYLKALLNSQQMMTLNAILSGIEQNDWTVELWHIRALQLASLHCYDKVIEVMEMAVKKAPSLPYSWYVLLDSHKKIGSDENIIVTILDRIPEEVFSLPSQFVFYLLAEMAIDGNFTKAEKFLIRLFVNDPESCAIPFTNIYLRLITNSKKTLNLSNNIDNCFGGICYSVDGEKATKLLVADDLATHRDLLSVSSPLGELLSRMSITDVEQLGMLDIKLIERLPPLIAAFHIASTLRQAINDGSDCFHSFRLPENPDEMFKTLKRKMLSSNKGKNDLIADPQIPLFMKGHHQNRSSPVNSALYHLTEKKSVKHSLPGFGESNPEQVILDIYSVSYLAITGLVNGIFNYPSKFIITIETKHYFEEWLKEINREDYLSIGTSPEGDLWRHTAEDIHKQTAAIQDAVKSILAISQVITPNMIDMPNKVLLIQDIVDLSVLSSLKLSIANDIPWLCIDEAFAQISKEIGYSIINANQFFSLIGQGLSLEQKKQGLYLHVSASLPYPLTYEDLIQLSKSTDDSDHYCLAEIIKMYPNPFPDTGSAILFFGQILKSILINAYSNGELLNGLREDNPRNTGYTERVFNVCCFTSMQCKDGQEAEKKLAYLLGYLLFIFQDIPSMNKLIQIMASRFVTGHFLSFNAINEHIDDVISIIKNNTHHPNTDELRLNH